MADVETDQTPNTPQTLRLTGRKLTASGTALGLKIGDTLAAINGKAFAGNAAALNERFAHAGGRPVALTFRRGEVDITVLALHPDLGKWELTPAITDWTGDRTDPDMMRNWEILRRADGAYDIQPLDVGMMALLCPPFWLLQNRLWVPTAAITAVIAISTAIWWVLFPFIYVACGVIVQRSGTTLFRLDRINQGMQPYAIVAATTEAGAHAAYGKIDPRGRFVYAAAQEPISEEELEIAD